MKDALQTAHEEVRLVLIHPGSEEIVMSGGQHRCVLPSVYIPAYSRHAEEVIAAAHRQHHLETYCLFTVPADSEPLPSHHYSFSCLSARDAAPPAGFEWTAADSVAREQFEDQGDFNALKAGFEVIRKCQREPQSGYFGRPGWLDEITDWIRRQVLRPELRLTGKFAQLNASPVTTLVRFETDVSAVWFKAVGEPNTREFPITLYLARHFPEFVPAVVRTHDESNGWLTEEVPGCHLHSDSDPATWIAVADSLARLQTMTIGHSLPLAAAGCIDVRSHALLEAVEPFLEVMAGLMDEQTKIHPAPLARTELKSLETILLDAIASVEALDVPPALVHLDFNPGNILTSPGRIVFLDWAAAAIGNPLFTFEYLLEQLRTLHPADRALQSEVSSAYMRRWRAFIGANDLARALSAAPLLAAFSYATSGGDWRDPARRSSPAAAGHLRSLTRRMKREADLWASGATHSAAFLQSR